MSEDPRQDENAKATLDQERESDGASEDFESLFAESSDDAGDEETPVKRSDLTRLEKGIKILATKIGREKKEVQPKDKQEEKQQRPIISPVMRSLYFKSNPEAELIWNEVEKESQLLGKDPFELYEGSSYFKGEAKAKLEARRVEDENKAKVGVPSSLVKGGKFSYDKIDLDNRDHIKWLNEKPERLSEYNEWVKLNWKK